MVIYDNKYSARYSIDLHAELTENDIQEITSWLRTHIENSVYAPMVYIDGVWYYIDDKTRQYNHLFVTEDKDAALLCSTHQEAESLAIKWSHVLYKVSIIPQ